MLTKIRHDVEEGLKLSEKVLKEKEIALSKAQAERDVAAKLYEDTQDVYTRVFGEEAPERLKAEKVQAKKLGRPKAVTADAPKAPKKSPTASNGLGTMATLIIGVMGSDTMSVPAIAQALEGKVKSKSLKGYVSSTISTGVKAGIFKNVARGQYCVSKRAAKKAMKTSAEAPTVKVAAPKATKAAKQDDSKVNKSAWIRSQPLTMKATEVVEKAAAEGISLSVGQVYTARSTASKTTPKAPKALKVEEELGVPKKSPLVLAMIDVMGSSTMCASEVVKGLRANGTLPDTNNPEGYISQVLSVEFKNGNFERLARGQYRVVGAKTQATAPAVKVTPVATLLTPVDDGVPESADDVFESLGLDPAQLVRERDNASA